jgi:hypothetical protein
VTSCTKFARTRDTPSIRLHLKTITRKRRERMPRGDRRRELERMQKERPNL